LSFNSFDSEAIRRDWAPLIEEWDGEYFPERRGSDGPGLTVRHGPFTLWLGVEHGGAPGPIFQVRAPFLNRTGLELNLSLEDLSAHVSRMLGGHDVEIGFPPFDQKFWLEASDPEVARSLFTPQLRDKIFQSPGKEIFFRVGRAHGLPKDVSVLFTGVRANRDDVTDRLRATFDFVAAMLDRLVYVGVADPHDPEVALW